MNNENLKYRKKINRLKDRLQTQLPGKQAHQKMLARVTDIPSQIPSDARASAVLSLIFPQEDELYLLLIKRTEDGSVHSGQISFPGGRQEPEDTDLRATALREAQEEVGIISSEVDILGGLTHLYIPVSNFLVYPFVAFAEKRPEYRLSTKEVAHVIEVPVREFLSENHKKTVRIASAADKTFVRKVNAYELSDGSVIWGATAMILSELEEIMTEQQW